MMPPRAPNSSPCPLDMRLFDPVALRENVSIEMAMSNLAHCVHTATLRSALQQLLTRPHLLEFAFSASDDEIATGLTDWILNDFPMSPDEYSSSLSYKILSRLSLSLLFMTYPTHSDTPEGISDFRHEVELTPLALQAIASLISMDNRTRKSHEDEEEPSNDIKVKMPQRQRKLIRHAESSWAMDSKPFENLKLDVPESLAQANTLAAKLLAKQKSVLKFYLDILRRPELIETFKLLYVSKEVEETSIPMALASTETNHEVIETEVPPAYPIVQPMKAALYFDSAKGFGEWRVFISSKAEKSLREARRQDANMFRIIVKKIKEFSQGYFSEDNQKRLTGPVTEIPIFEAKMTRDTRLVYQVDCIPEYDSEVERQVLRIFGVYTHAQLDGRFWDSMGHQLSKRGPEYKLRCTFRNQPHHSGDNVVSPATFPGPPDDIPLESRPLLELREEDLEELHSLLVLEKFVTFSQALLNSILADQDVAHVFNVSPQEKQIIEHASSCYVIGRSGTGKTTTMLFKMLGIERSAELMSETMQKPRQLFVTQSQVLVEKVEKYFSKLMDSLSVASYSPQELKSRAKVEKEFDMLDSDEEQAWRNDLPKSFSLLQDEDFPMFITFDRLCTLLEADIVLSGPSDLTSTHKADEENANPLMSPISPVASMDLGFRNANNLYGSGSSNDHMQHKRASFVSYDTFRDSYWFHFPQSLTKGLDPFLVFNEFMGVIKGSDKVLDLPDGYLDRAAYENLSYRSQPTFANHRKKIYSLFQAYLKLKRERQECDAADRTRSILRNVRENGVSGQKVDFLYVDEVQDNLLIDSLLLRSISRNRDGLFWAGDTAQTISVGSAFKFADLKALQYRIEEQISSKHNLAVKKPHEFQLTVNYRSHGGIVDCAHAVVELISEFWPHSIDVLARERGIVDGSKPAFFTGWDQDTVRYEQFLFGTAGSEIEFGARQCILVRNEAALNRLRQQVGDIGIIMTLYDSKGLEFDDVLLYNFFEDSTADLSQWRVVLNMINRAQAGHVIPPRFDEVKHISICSELKFLYVAITRSRKNLWIVDQSDKGEPMRLYWTAKDQVKNLDPSSDVPQLAISSTPEEWLDTAKVLHEHKRYLQAMHAYRRAERPREAAVALAYYSREQARLIPPSSRSGNSDRSKAFIKSAIAFEECATQADSKTQGKSLYRIAAECFVNAGNDERAANAYVNASKYTLAARHYRKAGIFDRVVEVVRMHRDEIDQHEANRLMDVSKMYFFKKNEVKKAIQLFASNEDALEFTEDYELDIARATLLEAMGRTNEAADLHFSEGRTLEAIKLLIDSHDVDSNSRASRFILEGFWQHLSFGVHLDKSNAIIAQLLAHSTRLDTSKLPANERDEVSMFQSIIAGDLKNLLLLGQKFNFVSNNFPAALLCLDHAFVTPPQVQGVPHIQVASLLSLFLAYIRLLDRVRSHKHPGNDPDLQKVFGFRYTEDHLFLIPEGTFLYPSANIETASCARSNEKGFFFPDHAFKRVFSQALSRRMEDRISAEDRACRETQGFAICLYAISSGKCNRDECPCLHIGSEDLTVQWYNTRIRLFLLQFLIIGLGRHKPLFHRHWLRALYEALNPPLHKLGSKKNLVPIDIPEANQGLNAIRESIRTLCYNLTPSLSSGSYDPDFLSAVMRASVLAFDFEIQAASYLRECNFSKLYRPQNLLQNGSYIVHQFMHSLQGAPDSLCSGVEFVRYVLCEKIPIDVGVLCDYMDRLCGSIVIFRCFESKKSLHQVMLPRTWFLNLCNDITKLTNVETRVTQKFLDVARLILSSIDSASSKGNVVRHLVHRGKYLSDVGPSIRNIYIFRMCKCLCILGYNISRDEFRQEILKTVNSLRTHDRMTPSIYGGYAWARAWNDIGRLVRKSTSDSPLDEMVVLLHAQKNVAPPRHQPPRPVVYEEQRDIYKLLGFESSTTTALRAEAMEFFPTVVQAPQPTSLSEEWHDDPQEDEPAIGEDSEDDALDDVADVDTAALSVEPASNDQKLFSEAQLAAAKLFLSKYRRIRFIRLQKGLWADRYQLWNACRAASQTMRWPSRFYRLLFLGPLAHILLCLEGVNRYAFLEKQVTKKKVNVEAHHALEGAMARQTKLRDLMKKSISLQKDLDPYSEFHQGRDVEGLRVRVSKVQELMKDLPADKQLKYQHDLVLGVTAIENPREMSKKKKPKLVVEELEFI